MKRLTEARKQDATTTLQQQHKIVVPRDDEGWAAKDMS
jgi:hypothetical protein